MKPGNTIAGLSTGTNAIVERRSELRLASNDEVSMKIPGWAGLPNPMHARIVNISGHGMCLQTAQPVETGSHVEIETPDGRLIGEICRCRPEPSGYSLGVRFVYPTKQPQS
jgi:hypothetical protein